MINVALVASGGAIGALLRYTAGSLFERLLVGSFPLGTLVVNVTGSLAIGLLWGMFERSSPSPDLKLFIFTGILGGYTTFSAFSLETFSLMKSGQYVTAILSVLLSIVLGIGAVGLGYVFTK